MKIFLIVVCATALWSCTNTNSNIIDFSKKAAFPKKSLSENAFWSIKQLDSPNYKIIWGLKNADTLITDSTYTLLGSGAPGYLTSNLSAIFLEQECGTNCTYIIVLPFEKKITPKLYYEPIALDTLHNLIARITEDSTTFFEIENFLTGKKLGFNEDNICQFPVKISCIDSCYFDDSYFYLKWFGERYAGPKKSDWIAKRFSTAHVIAR